MLTNEHSNFFYIALLIVGGLFAILNIRIGLRNMKEDRKNKDYSDLIKENAKLKQRNQALEKLIL